MRIKGHRSIYDFQSEYPTKISVPRSVKRPPMRKDNFSSAYAFLFHFDCHVDFPLMTMNMAAKEINRHKPYSSGVNNRVKMETPQQQLAL